MIAPLRSLIVASALGIATPVAAQSVDYSNAEAMFGEPVTVSVTGQPQRASEAPAAITILTADDIRRSGAIDIPSALRFVPGLDVRRYGQFASTIGIRGYTTAMNPRVLVLVDGRQVYQDDYGYTIWSLVPVTIAEIRQIEIIRGPNAALYGFNAVSGVVNIVTYDPLRDDKSSVSVVGGAQDLAYGEGVATFRPSENVGLRFSAKGARADEFEGRSFLSGTVEEPDLATGSAALHARLSERVQLDLSASAGRLRSDIYAEVGSYAPARNGDAHLRARLSASTSSGLAELDVYHNRAGVDSNIFGQAVGWDQAVTVAKASHLRRLNADHTVRVGAEYRHNVISAPEYYGRNLTSDLLAGSLGWNWEITPAVSLTNAARLDTVTFERDSDGASLPGLGDSFGNRRYTEISYNSALLWKPTEYDSVRLGTARALQIPSLFNYGFKGAIAGLFVLGSKQLDPSAVTSYEIGYGRMLPALHSDFSATLFHQDTDRTIGSPFGSGVTFVPPGFPVLAARNFQGSRAIGGEVGIDGEREGWRWNLSYALASVRDESPAAELASAPSVAYQAQTPTHAVIGGLGYSWGAFEADAQARWQSNFSDFRIDGLAIRPVRIPDYVTMTARLGYRLNEAATLSLTAEQANTSRQIQTAGRAIERRLLAGLKIEF